MAAWSFVKNPFVAPLSGVAVVAVGAGIYAVHQSHLAAPAPQHVAALAPVARPQPAPAPAPVAKPAAPAEAAQPAMDAPKFDIVRVEPSGDAVVAGRAAPGADVTLIDNGKKLASVKADANGQFVMLPKALPQGSHVLALSAATGAAGAVASSQTVVVAVAPKAQGGTMVALATPGKPTKLLNPPTPSPQEQATALAINSIDVEKDGAFLVAGKAPPSAAINLYLNNSFVAAAKAGADSHWSVTIKDGVPKGSFAVRADEIGNGSAQVVARVAVPFVAPAPPVVAVAAAAPPAATPAPAAKAAPAASAAKADVVVASIQTATVVHGDSLWRISRTIYGRGIRYTEIYKANAKQIRNPRLIFPGQVLVVPKKPG
ncbi:MAG: LysM peptidoglycan-binding domain-containing protein [Hyphomicrobiales bacterium]|nr:LysM peptidoglycan-binding domain-containing protein [Hyphomicrobiales bacterium]